MHRGSALEPVGRGSFAALLLWAAGTAGCFEAPVTQLLVFVATDLPVGAALDRVDVEVRSGDGSVLRSAASFAVGPSTRSGVHAMPLSFGVVPAVAEASGAVQVVVRGRGGGRERVVSSAVTRFVEGRRLWLPVFLDARCADRAACAEGETCVAGVCESASRPPETLRELGPGERGPTSVDVPPGPDAANDASDADEEPADVPEAPDAGAPPGTGPVLPEGATACLADYNTGQCQAMAVSFESPTPTACLPRGAGYRTRAYATGPWSATVITLPRPASRVRMFAAGTGGAGCEMTFLDPFGHALLDPRIRLWCDGVGKGQHPAQEVDFTAPATSDGIDRILLLRLSRATCYVANIVPTYR